MKAFHVVLQPGGVFVCYPGRLTLPSWTKVASPLFIAIRINERSEVQTGTGQRLIVLQCSGSHYGNTQQKKSKAETKISSGDGKKGDKNFKLKYQKFETKISN